jgi:lipopolysaccharide/colanic/teichoic acid biosynthesis glycosyltransferase
MQEGRNKIILENINQDWINKNIPREDNNFYLYFKEIADIFFGIVGFFIFIFSYIFIGTLIKLDSKGSVIFKQKRVGKNEKIFILYKFRTMHEDRNIGNEKWREKHKDNITKIGKFLRRLHLDEIPQAVNILRGDISFVGPRAEWVELAKTFEIEIPFYKNRYLVKPGLTGWAQINYPPSKSINEAREKFEYDLYYIKNRSIWLDLKIILKSFKLFKW